MKKIHKKRIAAKAAVAVLSACLLATSVPVAFAAEEQPSAVKAETAQEETKPQEETIPQAEADSTVAEEKQKASKAEPVGDGQDSAPEVNNGVTAVELISEPVEISFEQNAVSNGRGIYYEYYLPEDAKFRLSNGDVVGLGDWNGIYYNNDWYPVYISDDQTEHDWVSGTHTAYVEAMGGRFEIQVKLVDSPVDHISAEPVKIYRDRDLSSKLTDDYTYYDYYDYDLPEDITVYFKDGTTLKPERDIDNCLLFSVTDKNGETIEWYPELTDDQTPENTWDIGTHKAEFVFMGYKAEIDVEVLPAFFTEITVEPVTLTGETDGHVTGLESPGQKLWFEYYYMDKLKYKITLADGNVIEDEGYSFEYEDKEFFLDHSDNQESNRWKPGNTYTAEVSIGEAKTQVQVTLTESPVDTIEVSPVTVRYHTDGSYTDSYYDENTGKTRGAFRYIIDPAFTVTLKNGETYDCEGIFDNEKYSFGIVLTDSLIFDDKAEDVPYTKTVHALAGGREVTFDVNVVPSDTEKVELDKCTMYYLNDAYVEPNYEDGEVVSETYIYKPALSGAFTLKDGTKYYFKNEYEVYDENGKLCSPSEKNRIVYNCEEQKDLEPGIYKIPVEFNGVKTELELEIIESPVKSIDFKPVNLNLGENAVIVFNDFGYYTCRAFFTPEFTVTMNDGTVIESVDGAIEYNGKKYPLEYNESSLWANEMFCSYANVSILGYKGLLEIPGIHCEANHIFDEESGLSVIFDDSNAEYGYSFYSTPVDPEDIQGGEQAVACYNVRLLKDDEEFVPENGMVLNYFTEERGDYKAYRVEDDGALTALDTRTKTNKWGTMIIINTDKPGKILIADESKDADFITGDVNGDGAVNGKDAALLARYTSGWDGYADKVNSDAADINGDGKINGQDSAILMRYTSGWEGYARFFN